MISSLICWSYFIRYVRKIEITKLYNFYFIIAVKTYFISGRVQPLNEVKIPPTGRLDIKELRASTFDDTNGQINTDPSNNSAANILRTSIQNDLQVGNYKANVA